MPVIPSLSTLTSALLPLIVTSSSRPPSTSSSVRLPTDRIPSGPINGCDGCSFSIGPVDPSALTGIRMSVLWVTEFT